jgi:opacity protein-like surface antigen
MRSGNSFFCLLIAVLIGTANSARAQQNIGAAAATHKEVSRESPNGRGPLDVGDPLFRDEIVRTGLEATAKLIFLDSTNLAVGPISQVVLDRFIYDPSRPSEAMAVKLAKGVFRFTTGVLHKDAYSITTPIAAIGVRGTVLDISVQVSRTRVTLVDGRALVCPIRKGTTFTQQARDCEKSHSTHCECVSLDTPGQTAEVTKSGPVIHASLSPSPVRFASFCSKDGSLCSRDEYANLNPGVSPAPVSVPPVAPPFSWTGPLVGAIGGYSWDDERLYTNTWSHEVPRDGVFGGLSAGYNYQFNNFIAGVVAEYNLANIHGGVSPLPTYALTTKVSSFGSVDGHFGLAFDRLIVYGLGGVASAQIQHTIKLTGIETDNFSAFQTGHDWGGGAAYAITNNLAATAEFHSYHFGRADFGSVGLLGPHYALETLRSVLIGLLYSFGG